MAIEERQGASFLPFVSETPLQRSANKIYSEYTELQQQKQLLRAKESCESNVHRMIELNA